MKRKLLVSFVLVIVMIAVMQKQGAALVTPVSPKGIIDLEFARTEERLSQLLLFMDGQALRINLYLDFLFIFAYTWFLYTACLYIRSKTVWVKASGIFSAVAMSAGFFDVAENFILLLILQQRFDPALLQAVYYIAAIKFVFAGAVVIYLLFSWPFTLRRRS